MDDSYCFLPLFSWLLQLSQDSPKKRTCHSVSNILESEKDSNSPKLVKYYSSNVFEDASPGSRYRSASTKPKRAAVRRLANTATNRPSNFRGGRKKRPVSTISTDTSTSHSR